VEADATIQLWRDIAGINSDGYRSNALQNHPNDPELIYLTAFLEQNPSLLENYLRVYHADPQIALALIDLYAAQETSEEFTEIQEGYRNEAFLICIENGVFSPTWLRPEHLQNHTEKLEAALHAYDYIKINHEALSLLVEFQQDGKANDSMLSKAFKLAEDHPDNWLPQFVAAAIGSETTYDRASHYGKTSEAAIRYEELYRKENALTDTALYQLELSVSEMLMNCYDYEHALNYLLPLLENDKDGSIFLLVAECYEQSGQLEKCYQLSKDYLQKRLDNPYALYYAALGSLKTGQTDDAIDYLRGLALITEKSNDENCIYLDASLYSLLQYFTVSDTAQYTEYQYKVYESLTEEQLENIEKSSFLDHYIKALHYCYASKDENRTKLALEHIDQVLEINPNLPNAWYLKGAILFGASDEESIRESVTAYQNSLAIETKSPTVWYSLANSYFQLEEYELAKEACNRALSLVPEVDHGEDWYGVAHHCNALLNSVNQMLEQ